MVRFTILSAMFLSTFMNAQDLHISGKRIRADVQYLSSDEMAGRGVGTAGEKLATGYIASQLQSAGVAPGGENRSYFQQVPFIGTKLLPSASLSFQGEKGVTHLTLQKEYAGIPLSQKAENDFTAEAIFVGHGISARELGWDDYKGVDVKGKVLVYFTNEPPSDDPKFFGGPALTYYGRWTYKFEEATRRGAVAALIIHTDATAGYGWGVVSSSPEAEHPALKLKEGESGLKFAGWISQDAGRKLTSQTGKTLDELLALANQKSFRPIPLGVRVIGHFPVQLRAFNSVNVIGRVPGSDAGLKSQTVLFTAHWDHLGIGAPVNGDAIYNGAQDNATGCAVVLEMARLWAALPEKPKRSAEFVFVTAEESGLLGSRFYGEHPQTPAGRIAADLNFDEFFPFGKTRDVFVTGAERTTLWPLVQRDAKRLGLKIAPDAEPGQGHYYRSDHFSLARVGIPSFSISQGADYIGKPAGYGEGILKEFNEKHYHQPSDEYHEDWDFSGMEQIAEFGFTLGLDIANQPALPTWNNGDEFLKAREASGVRSPQ
jgi:Zn-dependent M28 family amino/carboxypeptidase